MFQVGDRIRIIDCQPYENYNNGDEGVITELNYTTDKPSRHDNVMVKFDDADFDREESYIVALAEMHKIVEPTIAPIIGDRIRVLAPDHRSLDAGFARGDEGVITEILGTGVNAAYRVTIDDYDGDVEDRRLYANEFEVTESEVTESASTTNWGVGEFKEGDKVVVSNPDQATLDYQILAGMTGTVVRSDSLITIVKLDKNADGWNSATPKSFINKELSLTEEKLPIGTVVVINTSRPEEAQLVKGELVTIVNRDASGPYIVAASDGDQWWVKRHHFDLIDATPAKPDPKFSVGSLIKTLGTTKHWTKGDLARVTMMSPDLDVILVEWLATDHEPTANKIHPTEFEVIS